MTALLFVSAAAITLFQATPVQQPVFRTDVQLVEVGAVVLDRKGSPVAGLALEDFEIREDGKAVKIVAFVPMAGGRERTSASTPPAKPAGEPGGRFVVLLLDDLFISPLRTPKIRELAGKFIDRLDGSDEIAVVKLNGGQSISTTNKEQARAALARYTRDRPPPPTLPGEWRARVDSAMDTVTELARQLAMVRHRRKAIVFIGSGALFAPTVPRAAGSGYSLSWFNAVRSLADVNASMYYIDPRGLVPEGTDVTVTSPGSIFGAAAASEAFDDPIAFTHETGGEAFVRSNLFDRAIERIWRESADYYLLGYEPPVTDGKRHTIAVEVRRKDVDVRARKSR